MNQKLINIINHYGVLPQLKHFQTEVFELNEAVITKINRDNFNPFIGLVNLSHRLSGTKDEYINHITEEVADVLVMLLQFIYYFDLDSKEIEKVFNYKIERQLNRIEGEVNEIKKRSLYCKL